MNWNTPAQKKVVEKTMSSLRANGIAATFVNSKEEAREKVLAMIPDGSPVMTMTSVTLVETGIEDIVKSSDKVHDIKSGLYQMDDGDSKREKGAAPRFAIGSVHAVTEDGVIIIASNTGSQIPAYAYGAEKVIWVIGTQKIVVNLDAGMKRVYEHVLPLESERAKKAYGASGSFVSKLLIVNKEIQPDRIHIVFVNESLGF